MKEFSSMGKMSMVLTNPTFQWGQNLLVDILPHWELWLCYNTIVDTSVTLCIFKSIRESSFIIRKELKKLQLHEIWRILHTGERPFKLKKIFLRSFTFINSYYARHPLQVISWEKSCIMSLKLLLLKCQNM